MNIRRVAVIIFYDNKKRILLQDRRGISKLGEEWGFFGGQIEDGETPEQTVVRETKEELCFDLKDFKYVGDYSYDITEYMKKKYPNFKFDKVLCRVFVSPLENNLSKFKLKEGKGMKLFSLDKAEKLKVSNEDIEMIRRLKKVL